MIVLLLRLYWEFLLIGMFSMGGGMATVPFLFDLSQRTAWFSTADLTTMIAISEATPGPIGVNMATYVGYITAGLPGGIVAPLGLTTPAFIIILLVSKIMNTLWQNPKVQGLFYALRPASVGLIAAAAFSVCAVSLFSTENGLTLHWPSILLFAVMLVAMNLPKLKNLSTLWFIAMAAVAGVVFHMVDEPNQSFPNQKSSGTERRFQSFLGLGSGFHQGLGDAVMDHLQRLLAVNELPAVKLDDGPKDQGADDIDPPPPGGAVDVVLLAVLQDELLGGASLLAR